MSKLKARLPNEDALLAALAERNTELTKTIRQELGPIEAEYQKANRVIKRNAIASIPLLILGVWFTNQLSSDDSSIWLIICLIGAMVFIGVNVVQAALRSKLTIADFNQKLDQHVYSNVFSLLGLSGDLLSPLPVSASELKKEPWWRLTQESVDMSNQANPVASEDIIARLKQSELITDPFNNITSDNIAVLTYQGRTLHMAELDLKHTSGQGKNRTTKNVFRGLFIEYELSRVLEGKTFVSTNGDRQGFGHRSFWNNILASAPRETVLEWNDFDNLLHVATTNGTEARYVLTTNFMADLYDWWLGKKGNIRVSFIGNKLGILFPDSTIRFHQTVPKITEPEVYDYRLSVALPLLHIMHLVEDVQL